MAAVYRSGRRVLQAQDPTPGEEGTDDIDE